MRAHPGHVTPFASRCQQSHGAHPEKVNYLVDIAWLSVYIGKVVVGFRNRGLEEIYLTGKTYRIGAEYVRKCVRILQSLEMATQPEDMNVAGFRFHSLHGNPRRWSVRVTGNYRITFGWTGEDAHDVDFEDYH